MPETIADHIVVALRRAAADPGGVPLTRAKSDPGLFAATAAGRLAAQKALDDGLLELTAATGLRPGREVATLTEKGVHALAELACPKQVLEDCVRALESRGDDAAKLTREVARLAATLDGMRTMVQAVLPRVESARICLSNGVAKAVNPNPERDAMPAVARTVTELSGALLARLADWGASAQAGQDCPLPELFRSLSTLEEPPTIGAFHDALRDLAAARRLYLHPWTGPLYAVPEPEYALLAGHNVAYYASARRG